MLRTRDVAQGFGRCDYDKDSDGEPILGHPGAQWHRRALIRGKQEGKSQKKMFWGFWCISWRNAYVGPGQSPGAPYTSTRVWPVMDNLLLPPSQHPPTPQPPQANTQCLQGHQQQPSHPVQRPQLPPHHRFHPSLWGTAALGRSLFIPLARSAVTNLGA